MSSNGWWLAPYWRELRKMMESGCKSDVKKARGLMGRLKRCRGAGEIEGLNSPPYEGCIMHNILIDFKYYKQIELSQLITRWLHFGYR